MRKLILLLLFALPVAASADPKVWPGFGFGQGIGIGGNSISTGSGIFETEPNITVGDYWEVERLGIDYAAPVGSVPVAGTVTITDFECVYDGTLVIGSDTFTACLVSKTASGDSSCHATVTFVNSASVIDYIAPATKPTASITASPIDTVLAVKTSAITDAGTANDSSLKAYCRYAYIESH